MARYDIHSCVAARPGREADLDVWCDQQHIPATLRLEEFVSAQRHRLTRSPQGVATSYWTVIIEPATPRFAA